MGGFFAFTFTGMSLLSPGLTKHSSTFTGSETAANVNSANAKAVTVKAKWKAACSYSAGQKWNFSYTGSRQDFTVPCDGSYKLEVWGAEGATTNQSTISYNHGNDGNGMGGYSIGTVTIDKSTTPTLYVWVGGKGSSGGITSNTNGGWNGGGGEKYASYIRGTNTYRGVSGGGATDISTIGGTMTLSDFIYKRTSNSYYSRIIVAGGGGSHGIYEGGKGGNGGGFSDTAAVIGIKGSSTGDSVSHNPGGGTISSAGANSLWYENIFDESIYSTSYKVSSQIVDAGFGYGARGYHCGDSSQAPGGGGGWYGGGTKSDHNDNAISSGGSGWVYTASNYATWKSANPTDANNYLLDSSYYLSNASTSTGVRSGDGYASITYLGT